MPTCHNCNHPKKETSYCWKACKLSETPPGQPYQGALVSIDAVHDANPLANMDAETDMPATPRNGIQDHPLNINATLALDLPDCCADTAHTLLSIMCQLADDSRNILFARLKGQSFAKIGRRHKLTRAAMSARWKGICAHIAVFKCLSERSASHETN
jgi:hypothetical protein